MASSWLEDRQKTDHAVVMLTLPYCWFPCLPPSLCVPPSLSWKRAPKQRGGTGTGRMESLEFKLQKSTYLVEIFRYF